MTPAAQQVAAKRAARLAGLTWTSDRLRAFEKRVEEAFLRREIQAPIHLSGGNEEALLGVFREVRPEDWVVSTWRSHYHALLKGVDPEVLFSEILAGRSMLVHSRQHRFLSSSIVAGGLPMALGIAMGIKRRGSGERVWAFVGDMAAETGLFHEAVKYAGGHRLPLKVVIEDNGLSTNTPTQAVWGDNPSQPCLPFEARWSYICPEAIGVYYGVDVRRYGYERVYPHTGVGEWVTFG